MRILFFSSFVFEKATTKALRSFLSVRFNFTHFCAASKQKKRNDKISLPYKPTPVKSSFQYQHLMHVRLQRDTFSVFGVNRSLESQEILEQFLAFTMQICSKSEWGSTSTVLMFMLYWREQVTGNCTYLLRNTRPTHTVNI